MLSSDARVRMELPGGWVTRDLKTVSGFVPRVFALLPPSSNTFETLIIPRETLCFQVGFKVRKTSLTDRVMSQIPRRWQRVLFPICAKVLSNKEGKDKEVWSDVFVVPETARGIDYGRADFIDGDTGFAR